ncbi:lipoate--protein ligase family protein [Candidatus Bipolaricaulota bacterium]|nr:lipoate--protein ligase family protein [Candidatus Bipolaricaulota bacterium]
MEEKGTLRVIKDLTLRKASSNLALEESLAKHVDGGMSPPTVRFWRNSFSAIVGRSQRVSNEVDTGFCRTHGVEIARRPSGGGSVIHHPENLNYSIYLPSDRDHRNKELKTQLYVEPLLEALNGSGLKARPSVNGIYVDEMKISGTAQSCRWGVLFHGTLLLRDHDIMSHMKELLLAHDGEYRGDDNYVSSDPSPVASVEELIGPPFRVSGFFDSWIGLLGEALNFTPLNGSISQQEWGKARELARDKYQADRWNYRFKA